MRIGLGLGCIALCCGVLWLGFLFEREEIEKIAKRLGVFRDPFIRNSFAKMYAIVIVTVCFGVNALLADYDLSIIKLYVIQILMFMVANNVFMPMVFVNYSDFTLKQLFFDPARNFIRRRFQYMMPDHNNDTSAQDSSNEQSNVNPNDDVNEEDSFNASDSDSSLDNHLITNDVGGGDGVGSGAGVDIGDGLYGDHLDFSGDDNVVEQPLVARAFTNAVSQSDMDSRRNSADTITESVARQRYIDRCLRELEYNRCTMPADEYEEAVASAKAAIGFSDFVNGNPYIIPDEEKIDDDPMDDMLSDMEDNGDDGFDGDDDPYGFNSPRRSPGKMARHYSIDPIDW